MRFVHSCVWLIVCGLLYIASAGWAAKNQAPNCTLTSPASGATFVAPASIALTATASDSDGTVINVKFYNGTTVLATDSSAPYAYTWHNVGVGTYILKAVATDNRGATKASTTATVTVRANTPPTVTLTAPANGTVVTSPDPITLTATASDSDGIINRVEFYQGSTLLATDNSAPYAYTWTNAPIGTHTLTAKAFDDRGANTTSTTASVTVRANTPPTVQITSPADGTVALAPIDMAVSVSASDSDGTIASVELFRDGASQGVDMSAPYDFVLAGLAPGAHQLIARATDNRGAVTTSTPINVTVRVNQPPTVTLTAPQDGATAIVPDTLAISATASDPDGSVTRVEFYQGSTLLASDTSAPYAYTWEGMTVGTYVITARAFDNDGASATSGAATVTVRVNAPPAVQITDPSDGAAVIAPTDVTIAVSASDADGTIATVRVYQNGQLIDTTTAAPYTVTWTCPGPGTYQLTAQADDDRGASATSAPVTVTAIANTPPTVTLSSPRDGLTYFTPATIWMEASATDAEGYVAKVDILRDGVVLRSSNSSMCFGDWTDVPAGTYTLQARATDDRGDVGFSAPVTVTVRTNLLPAVTITSPVDGTDDLYTPCTVNIAVAASDPDGSIARVDIYSNGALLRSCTMPEYTATQSITTAGTYTLTAIATDNDGAQTTSAPVTIIVNANTVPTVAILTPSNGTSIPTPAHITLTADAQDADGTVTLVEYFYHLSGGWGGDVDIPIGTATATPYTVTWPYVQPGTYEIFALATDDHGKSAISAGITINVTTDPGNTRPTVQFVTPQQQNAVFATGSIIGLTSQATDADGTIAEVRYWVYGGDFDETFGPLTAAPYQQVLATLPVGSYTAKVTALDDDGLLSNPDYRDFTITDDPGIGHPDIAVTSPTDGAVFQTSEYITLTAATSLTSFHAIDFFVDGTVVNRDWYLDAFTAIVGPLAIGSHTITARIIDTRGEMATSQPVTISVNAPVAPTITLTYPTANQVLEESWGVWMSASVTDPEGRCDAVRFSIDGVPQGTVNYAPYEYYVTESVGIGTHAVTAECLQNGEVIATSPVVTITVVDNIPPTVSIITPTTGATFDAWSLISIEALATDAGGGSVQEVELFVDGVSHGLFNTPVMIGDPYYTWLSDLPEGTYTLTAVATDIDGATTISAPITITLTAADMPWTAAYLEGCPWPAMTHYLTAPAMVTICTASYDPLDNITLVELLVNGDVVASSSSDMVYPWADIPVGTHTVRSRATDANGNVATSDPLTLIVCGYDPSNQAPLVSISTPGDGATFTMADPIYIEAQASDPDGAITMLEFYRNGVLDFVFTNAPAGYQLGGILPGTYTFTVVATDDKGAKTTSAPVTFTVTE